MAGKLDTVKVLVELGADTGARDMHAAGIGEGLERAGNREAAVDGELGRVLARYLDRAVGQRPRGATSVDAAALDGAGPQGIVEGECRLAAEDRDGRPELHADRATPQAITLIG